MTYWPNVISDFLLSLPGSGYTFVRFSNTPIAFVVGYTWSNGNGPGLMKNELLVLPPTVSVDLGIHVTSGLQIPITIMITISHI